MMQIAKLEQTWITPPELNFSTIFNYLTPEKSKQNAIIPQNHVLLKLNSSETCLDIGFGGILELDNCTCDAKVTYADERKFNIVSPRNNIILHSNLFDVDGKFDKIFSQQCLGFYSDEALIQFNHLLNKNGLIVLKSYFQTLQKEIVNFPSLAEKFGFKVDLKIYEGQVLSHTVYPEIKMKIAPTIIFTLSKVK